MALKPRKPRAKASTEKYQPALAALKKTDFKSGIAVERQVTSHVRTLIQQKKLPADSRIPPIRLLAKLWDTNYFTVQAALRRLVAEGLVVQSPKLGSFVAAAQRSFQRACLYHDHRLSSDTQETFFSQLNVFLYRLLAERGIQITTHFDHRRASQLGAAPSEVLDMVREHHIDAIIATGFRPENSAWLIKLGIPFASTVLDQNYGGVTLDFEDFVHKAMAAAARAGKRRVGIIQRRSLRPLSAHKNALGLLEYAAHAARGTGIEIITPKDSDAFQKIASLEETGYQLCEELLALANPPDALIIFPDIYTRGVVSALLKHNIRVPDDVLVLSHRNAEAPFFTPLPVTWFDVRIEESARALIKQIDTQIRGKKPRQATIPFYPASTSAPASPRTFKRSGKRK